MQEPARPLAIDNLRVEVVGRDGTESAHHFLYAADRSSGELVGLELDDAFEEVGRTRIRVGRVMDFVAHRRQPVGRRVRELRAAEHRCEGDEQQREAGRHGPRLTRDQPETQVAADGGRRRAAEKGDQAPARMVRLRPPRLAR